MKVYQHLLLSPALWLGLTVAFQADAAIYKWVDDEGVVQYSSTAPMDRDYDTLNSATNTPIRDIPAATEAEGDEEKPADQAATEQPKPADAAPKIDPAKQQEFCNTARQNLQTLQSTPRILKTDESGQASRMTEEDRQAEITKVQELIDKYCNN